MSSKLIKFYKGICLRKIHEKLEEQGILKSIELLDKELKEYAGFNCEISTKDMTSDEINELIISSFQFGDSIGVYINFLDNECDFIREL